MELLLILILIFGITGIFVPIISIFFIFLLAFVIFYGLFKLSYYIYEKKYFKGSKFLSIKERIKIHIDNCNELNEHIEDLKNTYINLELNKIDYGNAKFNDTSIYNYKRPELRKVQNDKNTHHCSRSVVSNAEQQPFKYICKYFNIKCDEKTVEKFEEILNNFIAAENGRQLLLDEKGEILKSIDSEIPKLIKKYSMNKLITNLGFKNVDLTNTFYPRFKFQYVSPAGNARYSTDVVLDNDNLERFIKFLADKVAFRKTIQGQRQLMTKALREQIKKRDNYTCKNCGVSIKQEPHLLLEIDHIKPLSKGGITEESNLQTLCWKCNRSKSNK